MAATSCTHRIIWRTGGPSSPIEGRRRSQSSRPSEKPALAGLRQSGCRDLNSGPLVPQTSALTRLRHTPEGSVYPAPPAPVRKAVVLPGITDLLQRRSAVAHPPLPPHGKRHRGQLRIRRTAASPNPVRDEARSPPRRALIRRSVLMRNIVILLFTAIVVSAVLVAGASARRSTT